MHRPMYQVEVEVKTHVTPLGPRAAIWWASTCFLRELLTQDQSLQHL